MKKLIQIALIVILVCALFQAMVGGAMAPANMAGSRTASSSLVTTNVAVENNQMASSSCFVYVKGMVCVMPNRVGWNG
jgi:hypothetical protein